MLTETKCLYLAVIPSYRTACMEVLHDRIGDDLVICAGPSQLDRSVRTGIPAGTYRSLTNHIIAGRLLFQSGQWKVALRSETTVLDLNPRSLSAWTLLALRRVRGMRTLVWGHLHPRAGRGAATAGLRRAMRRLASGTILYGYDSVLLAREELPNQQVWVAPNSLYFRKDMVAAAVPSPKERSHFIYVGRLVSSKKVDLAVEAVGILARGGEDVQLDIVGTGDQLAHLAKLAEDLEIADRVVFHGHVESPDALRRLYDSVVCSVSPGYAGLSLTQSLGFGVPIVVADDEPHAPEIELQRLGGVTFFEAGSAVEMARALRRKVDEIQAQDRVRLGERVKLGYSAEAMADGIARAFDGKPQALGDDGWPVE